MASYRREEYVVAPQQGGGRMRDPTENLVPILTKVSFNQSNQSNQSIE